MNKFTEYRINERYLNATFKDAFNLHVVGYNKAEDKTAAVDNLRKRKKEKLNRIEELETNLNNEITSFRNYLNLNTENKEQTNEIVNLILGYVDGFRFGNINRWQESYSGELKKLLEGLKAKIINIKGDFIAATTVLVHDLFDNACLCYQYYLQVDALDYLIDEIIKLNHQDKIQKMGLPENETNGMNGKSNHNLSEKCLNKINQIAKQNTYRSSRYVIKEAYKCKCCQKELVNGEEEDIGSWPTLRNRLRNKYTDLYRKTFKQK